MVQKERILFIYTWLPPKSLFNRGNFELVDFQGPSHKYIRPQTRTSYPVKLTVSFLKYVVLAVDVYYAIP